MNYNKGKDILEAMNDICKIKINKEILKSDLSNELSMFLDALFGKKRILIIKVGDNKEKIIEKVIKYAEQMRLEVCKLDTNSLNSSIIKGELEISYIDGMPYYKRKTPHYISENKQMIIVDNLNESIDIEVLRAFMYMASLECYYDDLNNLPKDKLPYGSAYTFIADDKFPIEKFASISSYWSDEAAILDLTKF